MSSHAESPTHDSGAHVADHGGHHTNYVKIWGILVALLVVSVTGPMLEIRVVTLLTAFGIAIVKAYLVAKHFMHLDVEKTFVVKLLVVCLGLMMLFFSATAPDIMKHWGANWRNESAKNANIPEHGHHEAAPAGAEVAPHAAAPAHGEAAPHPEAPPAHGEEPAH